METVPTKMNWVDLINESVHTSDDQDIGDIEAVSRDILVVKRGFINVHRYYIPMSKVDGWDGSVLWLKVTEDEVKRNYERSNVEPDPYRYFVKDFPYYATDYPPLIVIPQRYARPAYTVAAGKEKMGTYRCDICGIDFGSDIELSKHVQATH
jgi:hypothetical protein